jgi:hypothetical protein
VPSSAVATLAGAVVCSRDLGRCRRPPWRGGPVLWRAIATRSGPYLPSRFGSAFSRVVAACPGVVACCGGPIRRCGPAVASGSGVFARRRRLARPGPVYCRYPIRRPCVTWLPVTFRMPVRQGPASSSGSACAGRAGERRRLHRAGVQGPSAGRRPQGGTRGRVREAAHAVVFGRRHTRSCSGGAASGHRDTATLGVSLPFGVVREASLRRVRSIAVREALVRRP